MPSSSEPSLNAFVISLDSHVLANLFSRVNLKQKKVETVIKRHIRHPSSSDPSRQSYFPSHFTSSATHSPLVHSNSPVLHAKIHKYHCDEKSLHSTINP